MSEFPRKKALRVFLRFVAIVSVTYGFGWAMNKAVSLAADQAEPPGFGSGMIHGALMPGAMPSLLFGRDIVIYAPRNNGRLYKLGYTFGVNACGALFFGAFYWRLNRWRKEYGPEGGGDYGRLARVGARDA
jgi:hypothetical protein